MDMQASIDAIGAQLLKRARAAEIGKGRMMRAIDAFISHLGDNETLRVQALRLIDVLPTLDDDRAVVQHLQQYFADMGPLLPRAASWGLAHADDVPSKTLAPIVRGWVRWIGRRFIVDEGEIGRTLEMLHAAGKLASLDLLGENVLSEIEAEAYQQRYLRLIEHLGPHLNQQGRPLHLSLKVSALDSQFTPLAEAHSATRIARRLRPIMRALMHQGGGLTLDMEHYDCRDVTLRVFQELLMEPEFRKWRDCGIAQQAYLRDGEENLAMLIDWAATRGTSVHVRLVRGAYWDTEHIIARREGWPSPVWGNKADTDQSYERCLRLLIDNHRTVRPVIAGHNVRSVALALALIETNNVGAHDYELQMLYGMADGLQAALVEMGKPLRVYLPVGAIIPGMAYLVRRLLENSANTSFMHQAFAEDRPESELLRSPAVLTTLPQQASNRGFHNEPLRRFTAPAERAALASAIDHLRGELGRYYPLYIDGRPLDGNGQIVSHNPARPDEIIGSTAAAGIEQAKLAVAGATKAQATWQRRPVSERTAILRRAAELLTERREHFAALAILEAGKPWREADADIAEAIDHLRYNAAQAEQLAAGRDLSVAGEDNLQLYHPCGVAAIIPPWNFPLAILTGMLSASLAAGNSAIVKPSSETPVIAAHLLELLSEAGLPPGVAQFLPGEGSSLGDFLVGHPDVQVVAFTGSRTVGCHIQQRVVEGIEQHGYLKRVICEMGGKNAIIVDASADPDAAVAGIIHSAFGYAGQKCSACSRVIVVGEAYDALVGRLVQAADSLLAGNPERPENMLGPVISMAAKDRILSAIADARHRLTTALVRELPATDGGHYVGPAIFTEVSPDDALAQEEIFGPVLAVLRAANFDEAISIANSTKYALTGGVYSRTPAHLELARQNLEVGDLYLNRGITGAVVGRQPFGGFRLSGTGHQAGGADYLLQFTQARTISENTIRRGFAPETDV